MTDPRPGQVKTIRAERGARRAARKALRREVRAVAGELHPGLWVVAGPQLWLRAGGIPPSEHVRRTKGEPAAASVRARVRKVLSLRDSFWVGRRSRGTAEAAIVAFDGGVVLLDPTNQRVLRTYGHGAVSDQYIRWREAFSRHVSAPAFEVAGGGRLLIEDLVDGVHLLEVEPRARELVVRRLFDDYARLTKHEGEPRDGLLGTLSDAVQSSEVPEALRGAWVRADLSWLEGSTTWVPSAFEASAKNLMVALPSTPRPIDLGDLQPDPYFTYPIGIMIAAGDESLRAYVAGAFDSEIARLVAAAGGAPWHASRESREGLLLARIVYVAMRDARAAPSQERTQAFLDSLGPRWAAIESALNTP